MWDGYFFTLYCLSRLSKLELFLSPGSFGVGITSKVLQPPVSMESFTIPWMNAVLMQKLGFMSSGHSTLLWHRKIWASQDRCPHSSPHRSRQAPFPPYKEITANEWKTKWLKLHESRTSILAPLHKLSLAAMQSKGWNNFGTTVIFFYPGFHVGLLPKSFA